MEPPRPARIARLGLVPYRDAERLQERLVEARAADRIPDTILVLEHPPTITLGTSAMPGDLLRTELEYARRGIEILPASRGGRATYHGPGQIVCYPIAKLGPGEIVSWLGILQEIVLELLRAYGVAGARDPAQAGIRVPVAGNAKIASFGIRISRRVAHHGFSLNVDPDLAPFGEFIPCGVANENVTSIERLREEGLAPGAGAPMLDEIESRLSGIWARRLGLEGLPEVPAAGIWREAFPDDAPISLLPRPGAPDRVGPKPAWLRRPFPSGPDYARVAAQVEGNHLHTVCSSAACPNLGECWSAGTATLMLLGDVCTRACGFCAVATGRPPTLDRGEPARVAEAVAAMGIRYVVLTSVNRDDLPDGGAAIWAETIERLRARIVGIGIEVLIPDFLGSGEALETVLAARPDVLAHNLETVPRLYPTVRPKARYERSLAILRRAAAAGAAPGSGIVAKSGIMLGLGEAPHEVESVLADLAAAGVRIATLGQYLRPSPEHLPVDRWVHPDEFARWKERGESLGIAHVESGPLVRSSYHAERAGRALAEGKSARR